MLKKVLLVVFLIAGVESLFANPASEKTVLLIVGGGASGTTAAIQGSRMGIRTLMIEETTWLGGMPTSAGVSAIDHHHLKNRLAPPIDFVKIKVPSYNFPLGGLIPQSIDGLIVAEKSISVTNIVNGATRLQPVVLTIGQAAGTLAAISLKNHTQPREVNIRQVQQALIDLKGYLMLFIDVKPTDRDFWAIQHIGSTGILKGTGIPYKLANQTWFYPDQTINEDDFLAGMKSYYPSLNPVQTSGMLLTQGFFKEVLKTINPEFKLQNIAALDNAYDYDVLTRPEVAVPLDKILDPFNVPINFKGMTSNSNTIHINKLNQLN